MARQKTMLPPKPGKTQLLIKQTTTVAEATTGMRGGETRVGFLGNGANLIRKPDYVATETLSEDEKEAKKLIQKFLGATIVPNSLGGKSTPEQDLRSLIFKLNKRLLSELKVMLPQRFRDMGLDELKEALAGVTEEDKAEIQELYRDVSP